MVFNEADFVFNFVKAKEAIIDTVIYLINSVVYLIEAGRQITNSIFNAANLILNLIKAKDIIG
ncbi:hypothetical protein SDC9_13756 [bioreactor metagenome]|uniref:Uncharacterized protein n=1 Tax=bioreactor metagenome TaxID=1076179 RepID=A0A644TM80_9ZZZZ